MQKGTLRQTILHNFIDCFSKSFHKELRYLLSYLASNISCMLFKHLSCCFCKVSVFIQTDKASLQQLLLIPVCQRQHRQQRQATIRQPIFSPICQQLSADSHILTVQPGNRVYELSSPTPAQNQLSYLTQPRHQFQLDQLTSAKLLMRSTQVISSTS